MKFIRLLVLLLVASGMTANSVMAAEAETVARKQIVELLPEDFQPAFTKETVIKLNAIVRRSFDAINEYDDSIKQIRAVVAKASEEASEETMAMAKEKIAQVKGLTAKSQAALKDMNAAATELRNSDEVFNAAILAGMIDFVEDVEREISAQQTKLEKMLSEA